MKIASEIFEYPPAADWKRYRGRLDIKRIRSRVAIIFPNPSASGWTRNRAISLRSKLTGKVRPREKERQIEAEGGGIVERAMDRPRGKCISLGSSGIN